MAEPQGHLPHAEDLPDSILVAPYPAMDAGLVDHSAERDIELLMGVVRAIRNVRAEFKIPPNRLLNCLVEVSSSGAALARRRRP